MRSKICFLIVLSGILIAGCNRNGDLFSRTTISLKKVQKLNGEVIVPAQPGSNFYEIQTDGSLYAVLDFYSDTLLFVYSHDDNQPIHFSMRINPALTTHFVRPEVHDLQPWFELYNLGYNKIHRFGYDGNIFTKLKEIPLQYAYSNLETVPSLVSIAKGEKGIYGVPYEPLFVSTYHYYELDEYVRFGEPSLTIKPQIRPQALAYSCLPVLNEREGVIFTASRFTNTIHKYNLQDKLLQLIVLGDEYIQPVMQNNRLDVDNSIQCFIGAEATTKAFYLLYSGTELVTEKEMHILKFDWKGKLKKVYQTDRSLTAFAVDPTEKFLLGISRTQQGTEIIRYPI